MSRSASEPRLFLTIGHSTRSLEELIDLLKAHHATYLVDVRTIPRSRKNPQFNRDTLPGTLAEVAISYLHIAELGGLRHARQDSINTGWKNASFRGFADYMQTTPFEAGLAKLLELPAEANPALMCAEAVPWRCHRSLIADALVIRGLQVGHILSSTKRQAHRLTPFAKVNGLRIFYPEEQVHVH